MYQEGIELVPLDAPKAKNIVCPFCKNADKRKMYKGMRKILINTVWAVHCGECGGSGPGCSTLEEAIERFKYPHRNLQRLVGERDAERERYRDVEDALRNQLGDNANTVLWAKRMARCITRLAEVDTDLDPHFDD